MQAASPFLPAGFSILRYDQLDSTNEEAGRLAKGGSPEGVAVWAERQTSGRGRQAREWSSPPGNLYVSYLLRPSFGVERAAQLSFAAALAVGDAVRSLAPPSLDVAYKWPNDVLFNGRKGAGILLETSGTPDGRLQSLIIGIGVNIKASPDVARFPATCLIQEGCDKNLTAAAFLDALNVSLLGWIRRWLAEGFAPLRESWMAAAKGLGRQIEARLPRETLKGRFADLDEQGTLVLALSAGGFRKISAGDIYFLESGPCC